MKKMSNSFERKIFSKLSLKSNRSAPIIINNENQKFLRNSKSMENNNSSEKTESSLSNIKSAVAFNSGTAAQESQQHLDAMNKIVDETDNNLRQALQHATIRHEQLDELHFRSQEMLDKNENLVFGKLFIEFDIIKHNIPIRKRNHLPFSYHKISCRSCLKSVYINKICSQTIIKNIFFINKKFQ